MYHLTNYERETIINFNEGEDTASVYTCNKALRRRLEQLAQERPEECRLFKVSHWDQAVEYYIPKAWVKINPTRILSEDEKERRSAAAKANFAKKSPIITGAQETADAKTGTDIPQPLDGETCPPPSSGRNRTANK